MGKTAFFMYNLASMKPAWIGHTWTTPPATVLPRVVSAQYGQRPPSGGPANRCLNKLWVLDYARSDCGLARVGSLRSPWVARAAGTVHLYPPGTPYWEDTSTLRRLVREAWMIFAGGEQAGLRRLVDPRRRFARISDPARLLEPHLLEMAQAGATAGEAGFWRAQSELAAILALLCSLPTSGKKARGRLVLHPPSEHAGERGQVGADASNPSRAGLSGDRTAPARCLVEAAREFFRPRLSERITIAAVARHLLMSPSAFSHCYAQEAGQSPMAALADLRMELARNLLLRGLKMDAISRQTGFCDAFHFSKAFHKRCGMSPSTFRGDFWQRMRK
jgi:AraC-like DNA-binding protein